MTSYLPNAHMKSILGDNYHCYMYYFHFEAHCSTFFEIFIIFILKGHLSDLKFLCGMRHDLGKYNSEYFHPEKMA